MSGGPIARRVVVSGRVQGVGFRAATRRAARGRGVAGWVRNRADGTVEAHIEGLPEDVEALLAFVHAGPLGAGVARVVVQPAAPAGVLGFAIAPDA